MRHGRITEDTMRMCRNADSSRGKTLIRVGGTALSHMRESLSLVAVLLLASACGSARVGDVYGEEEIVEQSREERPRWLGAPWCPETKVCVQGSRTRAAALEHARADAQADAVKLFARQLQSKAKAKFESARSEGRLPELGEAPDVDQAIKEFFVAASKLQVEDVRVEDFWWRKTRSLGEDRRYHYYFNYYVLLSVPERTWKRKVKALLDRQKDKTTSAGHQALVKEMDEFAKDVFDESAN